MIVVEDFLWETTLALGPSLSGGIQGNSAAMACPMHAGKEKLRLAYIYRDEDVQSVMFRPCFRLLIVLFGGIVANYKRVLGQLFKETLRCRAVNVEVERLNGSEQRAQ